MTSPASPDETAARLLWDAYATSHPDVAGVTAEYVVEQFGDSPRMADELLALVISGRKRATRRWRPGPILTVTEHAATLSATRAKPVHGRYL